MARRGTLRPGVRRIAAALTLVAAATVAARAVADAPSGVQARHQDTLTTDVGFAGDEDVFTVELAEGGRLDVDVKAAKGATLLPVLRLVAPDGSEVVPPKGLKGAGSSKIKLKKLIAGPGTTGIWQVVLGGAADSTGGYAAGFKVSQPTSTSEKAVTVGSGETVEIGFAADSGSTVSVTVKGKKGTSVAGAALLGPDGEEIAGSRDAFVAQGSKLQLKKFPISAGFGRYQLAIDGGDAPATASAKVSVKLPKVAKRKDTLPPELALVEVVDPVVRQDDVARRLVLSGSGFLAGSRVEFTGEGVSVDAVAVADPGSLAVDVTVAADAAYGLRDLTVVPPPLLGEPQSITDAIRVLAPTPAITASSHSILKQDQQALTVVISGAGFRADGEFTIEEPGVSLLDAVVDSSSQLTLTLDVSADAELGPRDVTYTQPVAGGGDAVAAVDLFQVNYPDPVIDSVGPGILRQGDTSVLVTVTGSGFREAATLGISGDGLTLANPTLVSDSVYEVSVDVADDASYGRRDVTISQAAEGGGAVDSVTGAIRVNAPNPTATSISPGALTQGDSNVLFTLTGTNFRAGGTISVAGSGMTLSEVTVVSATTITFRVAAGTDASLGPQDVTFAHAATAGGETAVLPDAIQVDAPAPSASAISVATIKQLEEGLEITLTGGELRAGGTVSVSGAGVTVVSTTVDSRTSARFIVDVAELAAIGLRDVTFAQPAVGGGRSVTLSDVLTVHHPDPIIATVVPGGVRRTKSGTFRLNGVGFRAGGTVTTDATGVTLGTPVVVTGSILDVPYQIAADAPLLQGDVTYTQPAAGGGAADTFADAYGVFSAPPFFTSITPSRLSPGDVFVACTIIGVDLEDDSTVSFGDEALTVHDVTFVSTTRIDIVMSVGSAAALGKTSVIVQPPSGPPEPFDDEFNVIPADPTINGFSHPTLARGASAVEVEIHGTNFVTGDVPSVAGGGVSFANISVETSVLITADVDVTSGAALGARALTVTHSAVRGGRAATRPAAFAVTDTGPTVTAIHPPRIAATPQGGLTRWVDARITGTDFMSGAAVTVTRPGGSGVSVVAGSVNVVSATQLEARLSIAGAATPGTWDVKVTNPGNAGNSGTTGDDIIDVKDEFGLTVNQVVPASGATYGGNRVVVQGGGFVLGSVVEFGGRRAYSTQVVDENTLICTVPSPATASRTAATGVDVKVITPTSNVSRTSAYSYARDEESLFVEGTFPAHGATGVAASQRACCVRLSAPLGTLPTYSGSAPSFPTDTIYWSVGSAGSGTLGPNGRWLVYSRSTTTLLPAVANNAYTMNAPSGLVSLSGRALVPVRRDEEGYDDYSYQITPNTSDTTAPTVASTIPASSASTISTTAPIVVVMSEEIDPRTVTSTNITLKKGSTTIACHIDIGADLKTLTLYPHAELLTSSNHTVSVTTGVTDLHGNAVASTISWSFSTESGSDSNPPTIDAVIFERLPSSVDGAGTYVSGADSTGSASNPTSAAAGAAVAYDLFLPRSGFEVRVEFSDDGGVGIDESSFSAKCSAAIGSTAANTELAANFDVTMARAVWRIPASTPITAGENVTFSFTIGDYAFNTSSTGTATIDVAALTSSSSASGGGDLDPFGTRQTWVIRGELDEYTSSYSSQSGDPEQLMTSTSASNDVADMDEALRLVGLWTPSMTPSAASTMNGRDTGTNDIMRRLVLERVRELVRERFGIDADGTRDADSINVEFLLGGEAGSLASLPVYSEASSTDASQSYSEISITGTKGAESSGVTTAAVDGISAFDVRNLKQEALVNTDGSYGVFLTSMLKSRLGDSQTPSGNPYPFAARVLDPFGAPYGGTPVGEHASDDDVLADSFDRSTSANTTHNDRYDAIHDAIETVALFCTSAVAHEIGRASGLIPNGGPKTGLFGHAHRDNDFTDATSTMLNVSNHIYWAGMNNLMAPDGTFHEKIRTGSDFRRFSPLALAWLRGRVLHDEGQ